MTCKDCIHYGVCQYHIDEETNMTVEECSHGFKHKDQYISLPAYVGQKVWTIHENYANNGYESREGRVCALQQKADKSWNIMVYHDFVQRYCKKDIGHTLFFSSEEAEAFLWEIGTLEEDFPLLDRPPTY